MTRKEMNRAASDSNSAPGADEASTSNPQPNYKRPTARSQQKEAKLALRRIAVELIEPNPYQPTSRINVDPGTAEAFGRSILQHGILQSPLIRPHNEHYQCADGHLRLAGVKWIQASPEVPEERKKEYRFIACDIRELTDQEMADCVLEANTVRQDLNPIELATIYKQYIEDFKITQTELARRHNCSQGEIGNTIRLLELPDNIKEAIIAREITDTHGRQLLRLNVHDGLQQRMFKWCVDNRPSVNQLSDAINNTVWQTSKSLNPKSDRWEKPEFDVESCKDCDKRTTAAQPWGQEKKEDRCLDPDCWEKKNSAAVQEMLKEEEKALKKQLKKGEKVFTSKELDYNKRADIRPEEIDNPEECKTCEKTALFKYYAESTGKPERVCIDPACYRNKKTKKTRDTNKLKKEQDKALTEELGKFFLGVHQNPRGCLEVISRHVIELVSSDGLMDMVKIFTVPKLPNGRMDVKALRASLGSKTLDELLQITVAAIFERGRRSYHGDFSTELSDELKKDQAIILGTVDKLIAEITKFQEEYCRGCQYADEKIIGTGEECCINGTWAKRLDDEGRCKGRRPRSDEDFTEQMEHDLERQADERDKQLNAEEEAIAAEQEAQESPTDQIIYVDEEFLTEKVAPSYSGDTIAEKGSRVKKPFTHNDRLYINTGNDGKSYDCYLLTPREEFTGDVRTYGVPKGRDDNEYYDSLRNDPNGFYHRMLVIYGKRQYVLVGPEVEFRARDALALWQINNCSRCMFADLENVGTGEPCCTRVKGPDALGAICLARRDNITKEAG